MNLVLRPNTVVPIRIAQVPMPAYPVLLNIKPGGVVLSGKVADAIDRYKLDTADMPPSRFKSVRDDISRYSPIPVTRVALRRALHSYIGIIDSNNKPIMFALNSKGILLRKAPDDEKAWQLFDEYMDLERASALETRRRVAADEQATLIVKAIKHPGSQGGKFYFDKHGQVRYGAPTVPKAKHAAVTDHDVHVHLPKDHGMEGAPAELHKHVRKQAPVSMHEARKHVRGWIKDNYTGVDTKLIDKVTADMLRYFHDEGALHFKEKPAAEAVASGNTTFFKKREALVKPVLATAFDAQGTQLIVNGKSVRLSADAEHACYAFAKRFIVNEGTVKNQAAFVKGFDKSLQKMGVPAGTYDYKNFVKRIAAQPEKEREPKSKEAPTPQTHPQMFLKQDGQYVRLSDVRTPPGNFYTGKGKLGHWARALREEDLTMNVSQSAAPKGWKGKTVNDPTKDYYLTWRHPDTDELGYVYPSRANAYQKKFEEAQALGKAIESMRPTFISDIESAKNPERRASALCAYLMDKEHFRVGEESHAEDTGTFGVGSFRAEHVKVDGKHVIFSFPGKKGEPWNRVVDFSELPEALDFIKSCLKGKSKSERLWDGDNWSVNSKNINAYLDNFSQGGVKFTAKMFRTFHANKYMRTMLTALEDVGAKLNLSDADMKMLYKGFDTKDKNGKRLLNLKVGGQTLQQVLGLEVNHGSKGNKKQIIGILPTIATRMGHTVSSCRNSYIDPVLVTPFGKKHGWDERTVGEKKTRDDLPIWEKQHTAKPAKTLPQTKERSHRLTKTGETRADAKMRRASEKDAKTIDKRIDAKAAPLDDAAFAKIVQHATDKAPAAHGFGDRKVFIHHVYNAAKKQLGGMSLEDFKTRVVQANQKRGVVLARADLVSAMDPSNVDNSETKADGATFHFVKRTEK